MRPAPRRVVAIGGRSFAIEWNAAERTVAIDGGERVPAALDWRFGDGLATIHLDGEVLAARIGQTPGVVRLTARGATHVLRVSSPRVAALARHMLEKAPPDLSRILLAPMPGLLTQLHVEEGERVEPGQLLAVMEAMKMENGLRAQRAGTVERIHAKTGDVLAADAMILELS